MPALTNLVVNKFWLVLTVVFLLFVLSISKLYDFSSNEILISVEPSIDQLLPKDDHSKQYYNLVKQQFGNDETLLVAIEAEDIFTYDRLTLIKSLTEKIKKVDGVEKVISLANTANTYITDKGIKTKLALDDLPKDQDKLDLLRQRILENTLFNGNIISKNSKMTSLLVSFGSLSDAEMMSNHVIDKIRDTVSKEIADTELSGVFVHYTGNPFIKIETTKIILHDLIWLPLIVILIIATVLAFFFRTLHGVLVPLITAFVSVVFTLGIIVSFGYALNIVTAMIPALLMTLGLAYTVHNFSDFKTRCLNDTKNDSIYNIINQSLKSLMLPVLLASFTTSAGFLSLVFNNMNAIKQFGIFSIIGIFVITVLSLTLTPALLVLMGKVKKPETKNNLQTSFIDNAITSIAKFDYRNTKYIFFTAFIIFVFSLNKIPDIRVGTEYIGNFQSESFVANSFNKINDELSGANIFSVVIDIKDDSSFMDSHNLTEVEKIQLWLNNRPEIGSTISIIDFLKFTNYRMHNNEDSFNSIPESKDEIKNIFNFGNKSSLKNVIDKKRKSVRIIVRAKVIDSDKLSNLINEIEKRLAFTPNYLNAGVTGNSVLLNKTIAMIAEGQLVSIGISLVIVYLILSGLFMSLRIGLIALMPNLLPITVYFSALSIFDITLNPATSLIGPMVLGIAVDDTIHYFTHFSRDAKKLADDRKATITSLLAVGKPISYTTIGLCLGFLTFLFSDLKMQNQVGIMAAFTIAVAWLTDFILTPALCSKVRLATLWDVLTLDLGDKPHKSIPLLYGLKPSHAKIFALMSSIKSFPAGERLFTVGDEGNEMYIVIDGKLQVFLDTDDGRVDFSELTRGDVLGEVGLYHNLRSANVDVTEDTRLLRITPNSLDRLKKRYPRIAAQIFSNLNEVLVSRLVKASNRISQST